MAPKYLSPAHKRAVEHIAQANLQPKVRELAQRMGVRFSPLKTKKG